MNQKSILSGMRPTGKLHLGHWVGTLSNWVKLQNDYRCFFMVADWHAVMSEYKDLSRLNEYALDNVADWLAYGIDPDKSTIFVQSKVVEHLELFMALSCLAPLGWLSRCPTFKEQIRQLKEKEINTYAFLGYPVLQAADILLYKADCVPVGDDQLPHLEMTRELVRKFNGFYQQEVFKEPSALLNPVSRFMGLDGRKMSKSYQNFIALDEDEKVLEQKVLTMFTDPARQRKDDKGHPDICNVFSYYGVFKPQMKDEVYDWCTNAKKGCRECKTLIAKAICEFIAPYRAKKQEILAKKDYIRDILAEGNKKAKAAAEQTMEEVRLAMRL
jgi:tryptophanyl-tRNA synthetase